MQLLKFDGVRKYVVDLCERFVLILRSSPIAVEGRTGQVMLEDAAKQFAIPTMRCPVTGEPLPQCRV